MLLDRRVGDEFVVVEFGGRPEHDGLVHAILHSQHAHHPVTVVSCAVNDAELVVLEIILSFAGFRYHSGIHIKCWVKSPIALNNRLKTTGVVNNMFAGSCALFGHPLAFDSVGLSHGGRGWGYISCG